MTFLIFYRVSLKCLPPHSTHKSGIRFLVSRLTKRHRFTDGLRRRLSTETLEKRELLAADLAGDDMTSAHVVTLQTQTPVEIQAHIGDGLHASADLDLYRVELSHGQNLSVDVDAYYDDNGFNLSDLDSYLRIFDSSGQDVTPNAGYSYGYASSPNDYDQWGYYDDFLVFTAPSTGTFYIGVSSNSNTSYDPLIGGSGYGYGYWGETGDYRLQLLAGAPPVPTLNIAGTSVNENAGSASVTVSLSMASSETVSVNYQTHDGTAFTADDYASASGTLVFVTDRIAVVVFAELGL
jgi:hypothetical protein